MTWRWRLAQFFELWWWKNYLRNKNAADYTAWKTAYWRNLLEPHLSLLHILPNTTIADFGCGPAGVFLFFVKQKITAIDPLLYQYEKSIPHFAKENHPNVTFVESTIEDYRAIEKYDVIFCMNAINHVQNIEKSYDVLCRHLKPNGNLVMSIDAHNFSFFKTLFRLIPGDILHPHQYDLKEYKQFLAERQLTVSKTTLVKKEFFFNHYLILAKPDSHQL